MSKKLIKYEEVQQNLLWNSHICGNSWRKWVVVTSLTSLLRILLRPWKPAWWNDIVCSTTSWVPADKTVQWHPTTSLGTRLTKLKSSCVVLDTCIFVSVMKLWFYSIWIWVLPRCWCPKGASVSNAYFQRLNKNVLPKGCSVSIVHMLKTCMNSLNIYNFAWVELIENRVLHHVKRWMKSATKKDDQIQFGTIKAIQQLCISINGDLWWWTIDLH